MRENVFGARGRAFFLIAVSLVGQPGPAGAKERLTRRFDWRNGLPVSYVSNIEQDNRGFLWIGTPGGLVRFDGTEMRLVYDRGATIVQGSARAGAVMVLESQIGSYYKLSVVTAEGLGPVAGPRGEPLGRVRHAAVSGDGTLWVLPGDDERSLLRRDTQGQWLALALPAPPEDGFRQLRPGPRGNILAVSGSHVWQIDSSGRAERLASVSGALDFLRRVDGSLLVGANDRTLHGRVLEVRDGQVIERLTLRGRLISIVERGRTIWAAYDHGLVALREGEAPEFIRHEDGLTSGGPLLVDHEGSLWVGTFRGLVQYPEPDTVSWSVEFPVVGRRLARTKDTVWMSSWGDLLRVERSSGAWVAQKEPFVDYSAPCVDARGNMWTAPADGSGFLEYPPGRPPVLHPAKTVAPNGRCASGASGSLWFPTDRGLFYLNAFDKARPASVSLGAAETARPIDGVLEDSSGELWVTRGSEICHAPAAAVSERADPSCSCDEVEGARGLWTPIELPGGSLWVVSENVGVFRRFAGRWEPMPGSLHLPSSWLAGLAVSPSGGVWVLGAGGPVRVLERLDLEEGWEVVERLGAWQGLPTLSATDLVEDPDGTLWLATDASLVMVPASARHSLPAPPRVEVAEVLVDGRPCPTDRPLELPYRRNRLELRFSALSFRDPTLVRYRVRLNPHEPWSETTAQPFFRFMALPAGRYQVEVSATLDGARWSAAPGHFAFTVDRPLHLQVWFLALALAALAGILFSAHRIRVASLLRLERQRTRIAMDLHDAVGSGLGSIGILADLAVRPHTEDSRRKDLTGQVAAVAQELGTALSDIVWSLRPGSSSLESLAAYLTQRGGRLFPSESTAFVTDFPLVWPAVSLSPAVRRSVLLIALEALHNAARHSGAQRVALGIAPEGRRFKLWVADDGSGMPEAPAGRTGGMGLLNMRRRAEEIGAEITWSTSASSLSPGGGTVVTLLFRPNARDRNRA